MPFKLQTLLSLIFSQNDYIKIGLRLCKRQDLCNFYSQSNRQFFDTFEIFYRNVISVAKSFTEMHFWFVLPGRTVEPHRFSLFSLLMLTKLRSFKKNFFGLFYYVWLDYITIILNSLKFHGSMMTKISRFFQSMLYFLLLCSWQDCKGSHHMNYV